MNKDTKISQSPSEENLNTKVYLDLKHIASNLMKKERKNHTLSPTDLVHEAFIKIDNSKLVNMDRKAYLFILARQMRRFLVDYGRKKATKKHGDGQEQVLYTDALGLSQAEQIDFSIINNAIDELKHVSPRCAQAVELYYFTGTSRNETADLLEVSAPTLSRDLLFSKTFIANYIENSIQ